MSSMHTKKKTTTALPQSNSFTARNVNTSFATPAKIDQPKMTPSPAPKKSPAPSSRQQASENARVESEPSNDVDAKTATSSDALPGSGRKWNKSKPAASNRFAKPDLAAVQKALEGTDVSLSPTSTNTVTPMEREKSQETLLGGSVFGGDSFRDVRSPMSAARVGIDAKAHVPLSSSVVSQDLSVNSQDLNAESGVPEEVKTRISDTIESPVGIAPATPTESEMVFETPSTEPIRTPGFEHHDSGHSMPDLPDF